jgi:P-type E1-E2 ATPase
MIEICIMGRGHFQFEHLVLDLNGTITFDGQLIDGVIERIAQLKPLVEVHLVTADTLGRADALSQTLHVDLHKLTPGDECQQKLDFVRQLGAAGTICIGNGANDASMLQEASLGICVIGKEGASADAVKSAKIIVPDINVALDLLLKPSRLIATLRK